MSGDPRSSCLHLCHYISDHGQNAANDDRRKDDGDSGGDGGGGVAMDAA